MRINPLNLVGLLVLVGIGTLSGCAVMKIDVDVYKGPLANQTEVQTEQLAALALGAKPLLIDIRDILDGISVDSRGTVRQQTGLGYSEIALNLNYQRGSIPPPTSRPSAQPGAGYAHGERWLYHEQAIRLNAILSLYQDQTDPRISGLIEQAKGSLEKYKTAWLRFSDLERDRVVWLTLLPKADKSQKELAGAYQALLAPSMPPATSSTTAPWASSPSTGHSRNPVGIWTLHHANSLGSASSNAQYEELAESESVIDDANKLFASKLDAQAFVTSVREIAQSFLDQRQAIEDMFTDSLDVAEKVNGAGTPVGNAGGITSGCAKTAASLIERSYLYMILVNGGDAAAVQLKQRIAPGRDRFFDKSKINFANRQDADAFAAHLLEFGQKLEDQFRNDPIFTADALRRIHLDFMDHPESMIDSSELPLQLEEAKYGLARIRPLGSLPRTPQSIYPIALHPKPTSQPSGFELVPFFKSTVMDGIDLLIGYAIHDEIDSRVDAVASEADLQAWTNGATFSSGDGLDGGRLDTGIESAINEYMTAAQNYDKQINPTTKSGLDSARRSLVRQLIHFAEKLSFIAENQLLVEERYVAKPPNANLSVLNSDPLGLFYDPAKRYAAILQTIGNSILVSANELQEQDNFELSRDGPAATTRMSNALSSVRSVLINGALRDRLQQLIDDPTPLVDPQLIQQLADATTAATTAAAAAKDAKPPAQDTLPPLAAELAAAYGTLNVQNCLDLSADADVRSVVNTRWSAVTAATVSAKTLLTSLKPDLAKMYSDASNGAGANAQKAAKLGAILDVLSNCTDDAMSSIRSDYATELDKNSSLVVLNEVLRVAPQTVNNLVQAQKAKADAAAKTQAAATTAAAQAIAMADEITADVAVLTAQKDMDLSDADTTAIVQKCWSASPATVSAKTLMASVVTALPDAYAAAHNAVPADPDKVSKLGAVMDVLNNVTDTAMLAIRPDYATDQNKNTALNTLTQLLQVAPKTVNDLVQTAKAKASPSQKTPDVAAAQKNLQQAKATLVVTLKQILDANNIIAGQSGSLKELKAAIGNEMQAKQETSAVALLKSINPPEPPDVTITSGEKTPRDVFDSLLNTLQMERVAIVRENGTDSPAAQRLDAAIQLAETYRSDMIYIRTPSAYLRTSNVATIFQQGGKDIEWRNLLMAQELRGTPFFGELLDSAINGVPDYKAIKTIDRQFWQNINTVRVAGWGITNYVVTKDDIGNWYIKQYMADPSPMIDAAKAVALYNVGGTGAVAASNLLQSGSNSKSSATSADSAHIAVFQTDYQKATTAFVVDLLGDGKTKKSAQSTIEAAMDASLKNDSAISSDQLAAVQKALSAAKTSDDIAGEAGIKSTDDASAAGSKLPGDTLTALKGLSAYQERILAAIDALHLDQSAQIQTDQTTVTQDQAALATALATNPPPSGAISPYTAEATLGTAQTTLTSDLAKAKKAITAAKQDVLSAFAATLTPLVQKRLTISTTYATALGVLQKATAAAPFSSTTPPTTSPSASLSPKTSGN